MHCNTSTYLRTTKHPLVGDFWFTVRSNEDRKDEKKRVKADDMLVKLQHKQQPKLASTVRVEYTALSGIYHTTRV